MNAKIKTLFFALFLVVSATVNAQDAPKKYEYTTVIQRFSTLYISYAGKPFEQIVLPNTIKNNTLDNHESLEYVENMQNDGWQVFSTTQSETMFAMVLRRLKK